MGNDIILFDSAGVGLTNGSTASLFSGSAPTTVEEVGALGPALQVIVFDSNANSPAPGFFSSQFDVPNTDGSLTNQDLFLVISNDTGSEFGVIDLATVFAADDTPTAPVAESEALDMPDLITLGEVGIGD